MAQVSVSLEPQHVKVVERYAKKMGIRHFSVALQSIIHQFDQQQKTVSALSETDPKPEPAQAA